MFTKITKPSQLSAADRKRLAEIRKNQADPAKSLNETLGLTYSNSDDDVFGFTSSRELDIDFSKFENHTFFSSAESNSKVAFSKILTGDENAYPYYGSDSDYENWLNSLTGYENYIFNSWPKNTGFLYLSGSEYVVAKDNSNVLLAAERIMSGSETINPMTSSMTVEFHLNPLATGTTSGTLFDYTNFSATQGYQIHVNTYGSTHAMTASMVSGSRTEQASFIIPNGFNHYACIFDRSRELDKVKIYGNFVLSASSDRLNEIKSIDVTNSNIYLGVNSVAGNTPGSNLLSASIDEFRVWSTARTPEELKVNAKRTVRAQDGLRLLWTLNNPAYLVDGAVTRSRYVTDFSGLEIHGQIINYQSGTRQTTGSSEIGLNPMIYETKAPILMSDHPRVDDLYQFVINNAVQYDIANPNLITKLVPNEILKMSRTGLDPTEELASRIDYLSQYSDYIQGISEKKTSESQGVLEAFLFVVAKMFDEIKIFIDQFGYLNSDSYRGKRFPDKLLNLLLNQYGIDLSGLFNSSSLDKFLRGENVQVDGDLVTDSLEQIRGIIWRRVLNNTIHILKQKGTRESLENMFRAIGIDPDSNFKIREYGGFNQATIENRWVRSSKPTPFIDLSSGTNGLQVPAMRLYASGSNISDGFHIEQLIKLPNDQGRGLDMSAGRLMLPNAFSGTWDVYSNVRTFSSFQGSPGVEWVYQPVSSSLPPVILSLTGTFYDGKIYRLAYGRKMRTSGTFGTHVADYYLSMKAIEYDNIQGAYRTDQTGSTDNDFISSGMPAPFVANNVNLHYGVNWTTGSITEVAHPQMPLTARSDFEIAEIHTYRTHLKDLEVSEVHDLNPFSISIDPFAKKLFKATDPISTFSDIYPHGQLVNVVQFDQSSGSINNGTTLPIASSTLAAQNGIELVNFAQTYTLGTGSSPIRSPWQSFLSSSLPVGVDPRKYDILQYQQLTPDWDRAGADSLNRIIVREGDDAIYPNPELLPEYDPRVAIDFSVSDILNQDIILILSSLQKLGNAISTYRNRFTYDFVELQHLRKVYFKRLEQRIQMQEFFKFFRYFDDNLIDFILPLIPAKVEFLGGRFIIEPHALERGKYVYQDYNGLFTSGRSPREIREAAQVPVLEGSMLPVGSEAGGRTMDVYHKGGAGVFGSQNTIYTPQGNTRIINSVIRTPGETIEFDIISAISGTQQRPVDYDEIMPFSWRYKLFTGGNSDFIRDLFDQDPKTIDFSEFSC